MAARIIGVALAVLGLIVNFMYKFILKKLFRVERITNNHIIRVKIAGLILAVIGAVIVFIFG